MAPPDRSNIPEPRRLLVRGVNWLGDAVMTTPALLRLRERFPQAHIALLTPAKLADLWHHHPALSELVPFYPGEGSWTISRRLKAANFDVGLIFPNSPRSALELWLARIPERIGYSRPWRDWFLTRRVANRPGHQRMPKRSVREIRRLAAGPSSSETGQQQMSFAAHQMQDYLHLAATLGANSAPLAPALTVTPGETAAVAQRFELSLEVPILGLNPGAEYGPAKRWPPDRFVEAAIAIQRKIHCQWLIFGAAGDTHLAAQVAEGIRRALAPDPDELRPFNLAGQTSLRDLLALLKLCRVVLTNDTGPMHAAAAVGTRVVVPFGSTSPELTAPGLPGDSRHQLLRAAVACSPCFRRTCPIDFRCMRAITVDQVIAAVLHAATPV